MISLFLPGFRWSPCQFACTDLNSFAYLETRLSFVRHRNSALRERLADPTAAAIPAWYSVPVEKRTPEIAAVAERGLPQGNASPPCGLPLLDWSRLENG